MGTRILTLLKWDKVVFGETNESGECLFVAVSLSLEYKVANGPTFEPIVLCQAPGFVVSEEIYQEDYGGSFFFQMPATGPLIQVLPVIIQQCEPDPELAPLVRQLFERYATGNHSLLEVKEKVQSEGFAYRKNGRKIPKSVIHKILTNPISTCCYSL